jgi:hypothetical protein
MATEPAFASAIKIGAATVGSAETNLSAPAQSVVIVTAGASGTKIEEVVVHAMTTTLTPTTVAGLVYLFAYDGTTYHLFDTIVVTAVTASTTVAPFRTNRMYANLVLPTGWFLRASQSIAGNASLLKVEAFGGDL